MNKNELIKEYGEYVLLPDPQAFEILIAGVASHFMHRAVPFWVLYVGASGSGKSTALDIFTEHERTNALDSWTARTLQSGLDDVKEQYINVHNDKVWVVSDLSEVINNPNEKGVILSQLRLVYDGKLSRGFGSETQEVAWKGKITFIVGVTDAIDRDATFMRDNSLGERFSRVNIRGAETRREAAERAFRARVGGAENKDYLRGIAHDFLDETIDRAYDFKITTPEWVESQLITIGDCASELRTPISGKSASGIEDMPSPEFGTRLSQQLGVLADSNAMLDNRHTLNIDDVHLATRVGIDAIPRVRSRVLSALLNGAKNKAQIERFTHMPYATVAIHVDQLFALEVVNKFESKIYPEWETKLETSGLARELVENFKPRIDNWKEKEVEDTGE